MKNKISKADFAREYGYSKAAVTKFDRAGKIVYLPDGSVDIIASKELIDSMADPAREDVRIANALKREGNGGENLTIKSSSYEAYQNARSVKEKYLALQAKADYEKNTGLLIEKSIIERIIFERARQVRDGAIACSRRIAPEVIGKESIQEIESIINREMRAMLEQFSQLPVVE